MILLRPSLQLMKGVVVPFALFFGVKQFFLELLVFFNDLLNQFVLGFHPSDDFHVVKNLRVFRMRSNKKLTNIFPVHVVLKKRINRE